MTRWVVDSNVLIDATRGYAPADRFLDSAADQGEIWSVTPVRTEILWGLLEHERARMDVLFSRIEWLDVSVGLADHAGEHGQRWGRSHGLGVIDAILAAATEELEAELATLNVRHFPMFPGLQPPY